MDGSRHAMISLEFSSRQRRRRRTVFVVSFASPFSGISILLLPIDTFLEGVALHVQGERERIEGGKYCYSTTGTDDDRNHSPTTETSFSSPPRV